jgi:hypothetical protein
MATDTWFSSEKDVSGATCAQIFVGMESFYTWMDGMKTESEGPSKLKKFIRQIGAPFALRNDNSKMQTGVAFMDICNFYNIGTQTTEPHHPQQNPAENRIGTLKNVTNRLMDRTGCPAFHWLRASIYCCMLLNVVAHRQLLWRTPTEVCLGYTPDISPFLQFEFYEDVYYYDNDSKGFPTPKELKGKWGGPTQNCGSMMTYWIWPESGTEWIARSAVRSARIPPDGKTNPPVTLRLTLDPPAPSPTDSSPADFEDSIDPEDDLPPLTPRLPDMSSDGASFDRFRSLREEISKASGEETGISIDPSANGNSCGND